MLKILQASLQQFVNQKISDIQAGFRKGRGIRGQTVKIHWIIEKAIDSRKTSTSASLTMLKLFFNSVDHNKLWKILRDIVIPNHLTCLLRNLYTGHEATVRTGHRTTNWF